MKKSLTNLFIFVNIMLQLLIARKYSPVAQWWSVGLIAKTEGLRTERKRS